MHKGTAPGYNRGFFIGYLEYAASIGLQGDEGSVPLYTPLLPELICIRSGNLLMSQLDKLLEIAAQENVLVKHELEIMGKDLTFWSTPLKIDEWQMATQAAKNPTNQLEITARLFIMKALDQSGRPQYAIDALPVLTKKLSLATATEILKAMDRTQEEEMESLDMKSDQKGSKKTKPADG